MKTILFGLINFSAGITIGSAFSAFISLLNFIPRMIQITNTKKHIVLYQNCIALGATISSLLYFFNIIIKLNKIISAIISLAMGIFVGLFSSALAEVLNVIPVLSKKLKTKHKLKYITTSLLFGKTFGSLWYWLVLLRR